MNTREFLVTAWSWNPTLIVLCGAALAVYLWVFRGSARYGNLLAAVAVLFVTLCSPLNGLADGYLFSAHMIQHILLLLIVPALFLRSLPPGMALPKALKRLANPLVCWMCGVGSMWLWHAPALCNAAVSSKPVYGLQVVSLLVLGGAFWLQILAPREEQRLAPLPAVVYLFTACTACTALGIILTFSPVTVCSIYVQPADELGLLGTIRGSWGFSPERDQQVGGLLMWVPMCLIYLSAIFVQVARWYGAGAAAPALDCAAVGPGRR